MADGDQRGDGGVCTADETSQKVRDELQKLGESLGLDLDLDQALLDHEDETTERESRKRTARTAHTAHTVRDIAQSIASDAGAAADAAVLKAQEVLKEKRAARLERNRVPEHKRRIKRHRAMTKDTMLLNDGTGKYEIFSISFDVFSPEERASLAVREITESKLYDNGVPQDNGPMSYYLGSYRASHYCQTCDSRGGAGTGQCTGHYGIVKFPEPVFHPLFFKDWTCKFLSMFCFFCGHPTRDWTRVTAKTAKRAIPQYLKLPKLGSSQHALSCCPNCEARAQPDYECSDQSILIKWPAKAEFDNEAEEEYARQEFTCMRANQILEGVPRWFWQDVLKLQSHPKDICVLTSMLVPPTLIRPSIIKHNSTGEMDLTKMLCACVFSQLLYYPRGYFAHTLTRTLTRTRTHTHTHTHTHAHTHTHTRSLTYTLHTLFTRTQATSSSSRTSCEPSPTKRCSPSCSRRSTCTTTRT